MRKFGGVVAAVVVLVGLTATPALARMGDHAKDWEAVLGHRHTQAKARALVDQAAAKGFTAETERDGKRNWEVEINGFKTQADAKAEVMKVRAAGLHANVERS